jgi:ubiquitin carboxyl-terminal hydrolase 4/11/15
MNSSLQCLSNTFELTKFFLEERFKFLNDLKVKNSLGTEGRLVMAFAKTLNEMWNMDANLVRPEMFKRILGEYATQFQGYGQHDSHECINTILDLLGEDLYRKGKKPYIDLEERNDLDEEMAAKEAWNRHLYRNESIITDLFHGQFKSTVSCSKCDCVSITFDPMMTMLLPIPAKKQ